MTAVTVGILPFETFGAEKTSTMGHECGQLITQFLSHTPSIVVIPERDVKTVINNNVVSELTPERLKHIAKLLNANFLILGSITRIRDEISIDAQLFYNFPGDNYFKTYAEGTDLTVVAKDVARKLEQEILDMAALVQPSQRSTIIVSNIPKSSPDEKKLAYEEYVDRTLSETQHQVAEKEKDVSKTGAGEEPEESELTHKNAMETKSERITPPHIAGSELKDSKQTDTTIQQRGSFPQSSPDKDSKKEAAAIEGVTLDKPINISADTLEYDNKNNSAVFRGNVVARQNEVVLFADMISVIYARSVEHESGRGRVQQLTAEGNVKVIQGERIATGQKIVFYNDEQKIVATGNPRVWQGDNVITGNKITVYLKEDRSVVEGTMQERVSATIFPKDKRKQNK
ncbi:MAG: lipopolysaccharide transport periplasmic protein LptA [Desulfobacterota bacterium]|nr:lipopolysaccharide transport periplasmic protein LptA [Thermodesulfobacteriota bacterium]